MYVKILICLYTYRNKLVCIIYNIKIFICFGSTLSLQETQGMCLGRGNLLKTAESLPLAKSMCAVEYKSIPSPSNGMPWYFCKAQVF